MQLKGMGAALAGNIIFGFTFVFTKQVLNAGMSAYTMLSWRLAIATLLMLALWAFGALRLRFRGKKLWKLLPVGLCEPCLYFIFESIGIARTTAAESGIIIALIPICVLVLCRLFFKDRQTRGQLAGVLISVAGVVFVVLSGGLNASFSLLGYFCLFAAVVIAGCYNIGIRWLANEFSSAEITFGTSLLGLTFFSLLSTGEGLLKHNFDAMWLLPLSQPQVLLNLILLGAGASVGAFMLVIYAIGRIGPTRSSTFCGFSTITGIVCGMVMLGERMLPWQLLGAAMIIAGVWCANYFVQPAPAAEEGR